jgi:glycine/D-amino acid oxidase-like deaminating enzyme
MQLPTRATYVVIGAGVHGLSTAWHLAKELKVRGRGSDVIVLDKTGVAAGASGIACGVIRNNYFQPAMRKLMAHSVSLWESDPDVDQPASEVAVDPYGPESPDFVVGEDFARMWTSALAHCHGRFEGKGNLFSKEPSGCIGCFTPDSFPIFDTFRDNAYVIADSNHGYKMIGIGALVAKELMDEPQGLLEPFRYSRFETGELHPTSHSPFPWS